MAIRIASPLSDTTLVARTMSVTKLMLVAAPGYVRTDGLLRTAEEFNGHNLLTFVGASSDWELSASRVHWLR